MKILRINMTNKSVTDEVLPKKYELLGGRGICSAIIAAEVPPLCHPLGPDNKLVFAAGLMTATGLTCADRFSVGAKSPLTGTIKESNSGGLNANNMARLGLRAIVVEGQPTNRAIYILKVSKDGVTFNEANDYRGLGNYETVKKAKKQFGSHVSVVSIGPAGEWKLPASSIASTDVDGNPTRQSGRGGLGAVMGSKGLKAIVLDDAGAPAHAEIKDYETFRKETIEYHKFVAGAKQVLTKYGTANLVNPINAVHALPTRNFSQGNFEHAEDISGERMYDIIVSRGGNPSHRCMKTCVIRCSNVYNDANGKYLTAALEYETIAMNGSNCGIRDYDTIATIDRNCDDLGLDTIDFGAAMAVMMDAGMIPFGDGKAVIDLLGEVHKGTLTGKLVGSGAAIVGKVLGHYRTPQVKGQSLAGYDPRSLKAMGVTYTTSPMGADHTCGPALPGRTGFDQKKKWDAASRDVAVELSHDLQVIIAALDNVGICYFIGPDMTSINYVTRFLNLKNGSNLTPDALLDIGRSVLRTEVEFNRRAGIGPETDRLPEFFYKETLLDCGRIHDVAPEDAQGVFRY